MEILSVDKIKEKIETIGSTVLPNSGWAESIHLDRVAKTLDGHKITEEENLYSKDVEYTYRLCLQVKTILLEELNTLPYKKDVYNNVRERVAQVMFNELYEDIYSKLCKIYYKLDYSSKHDVKKSLKELLDNFEK